MTRKDCYVILGLCEGASLEDVKKAYRKRAFELHPDLNPSDKASKQFQELNEAYVLMLTWLEEDASFAPRAKAGSQEKGEQHSAKTAKPKPESKTAGSPSSNKTQSKSESKFDFAGFKQKFTGPSGSSGSSASSGFSGKSSAGSCGGNNNSTGTYANSTASGASGASGSRDRHISQQEVMDNVLRDPFARRVFEDIYSEIKRGGSAAARRKAPQLGDALAFNTGKNVVNSVKSWFRKQIDDEQTVEVDAASIRPGVRIRLQIQQGISGKMQNIEVTLPLDYMPGRPLRLRGLGRKIGPWLGDLYLRVVPKHFKI